MVTAMRSSCRFGPATAVTTVTVGDSSSTAPTRPVTRTTTRDVATTSRTAPVARRPADRCRRPTTSHANAWPATVTKAMKVRVVTSARGSSRSVPLM